MKIPNMMVTILLAVLLLTLTILAACNGDDGNGTAPPTTPVTTQPSPTKTIPPKPIKIIIGNHTDVTGVSSNAMELLTIALEDTAEYYTENNLIPGVEFEVITYDGQYDPSRDIPGYEWLKERGADFIFSPVGATAVTLKPFLEEDKMILFMMAPHIDAFVPPGWVFAPGNALFAEQMYTLLKWVAENDPDFPQDRPAKIGGAFWNESTGLAMLGGAEEYANAHPDQYEWEGSHLAPLGTFIWEAEAEALKDCDYVLPPVPPNAFVRAFRNKEATATFLGSDAHVAFLGQLSDADLWEECDGMMVIRPFRWWNEEGELVDLTKQLLNENHPDDAESIIQKGVGYITVQPAYIMLEMVRATVEAVGNINFSSEAMYEVAQSFAITIDGCHHSFSETKRTSNDELNIDQLRAAEKDLFRMHDDWLPIVWKP